MITGDKTSLEIFNFAFLKIKIVFVYRSIERGDLRDVQAKFVAMDLCDGYEKELSNLRNSNGYPPLHVALLFNRDNVARFLIDHSGDKLVTQTIDCTEECDHLTPLHLALYQADSNIVEKIVKSVPTDTKEKYINKRISVTSYMGQSYGELPLAACTWSCMKNGKSEDFKEILKCLVRNGAKLDLQTEKEGNTLLHLIVLQVLECMSGLDFFQDFLVDAFSTAAVKWWKKRQERHSYANPISVVPQDEVSSKQEAIRYLMSLKNKDGLTPLTLAAKVESPMYLIFVEWNGVMCLHDPKGQNFAPKFYYDITDIVSVDERGKYKRNSVMNVLAHNNIDLFRRSWKTDIVITEPMKTLIKKKWRFYSWFFYGWGLFHIAYMTLFTYLTLTDLQTNSPRLNTSSDGSTKNQSNTQVQENEATGNPYFVLLLTVPILYFGCEAWDFVKHTRNKAEMRYNITGNSAYRIISVLFTIFTVTWFMLHIVKNVNQDVLLSVSLLFGWIYCIFFTRTISFPSKESQIGAFSIMVQRMLFYDLIPFLLISFFIIVSFSTAIQATLMFTQPPEEADLSFRHTFYQMIKYFAGLDDPMTEGLSREQEFVKTLLTIYGLMIVVLLINMLIAAMNKSYDIVRETRVNLVGRQRLAILLLLERRLWFWRLMSQKRLRTTMLNGRLYITVIQKSILHQLSKSRLPKMNKSK